jgi:hypothetical protein
LAVAAPALGAPELVKVGDFDAPTYAVGAPGDASRVFVVEKPGRLRLVRDGAVLPTPFLDVSAATLSSDQERGLLSAAFAPDYATSGKLYVYLTARPAGEIQVWEFVRSAANPDVADPASGRLLLAIGHADASNHNGGQLQFGPDGKLWLGTGDGGGGNDQFGHAQDLGSLLGKLIRLDPAAPAPEIVSRGLRNPWRFSFDRATGQLLIGDVGQGAWEEVDAGVAADYGWPCFEGAAPGPSSPASCLSGAAGPVLTKSHGDGFCSITGGYVVRDPGLPSLAGRYLYGDFCSPGLRSVDVLDPASDAAVGLSVPQLSSFGEDACGRLLVVSLAGPVYRLVDGALSACGSTPPGPVAPPADTRACVVSTSVSGLRSVRRLKRFTVTLRTDEACVAEIRARIRGVARFKTVAPAVTPGRRTVVRVGLTTHGAKAVRRALRRHRSLRVELTVRARDAAGNERTRSRFVRVRR